MMTLMKLLSLTTFLAFVMSLGYRYILLNAPGEMRVQKLTVFDLEQREKSIKELDQLSVLVTKKTAPLIKTPDEMIPEAVLAENLLARVLQEYEAAFYRDDKSDQQKFDLQKEVIKLKTELKKPLANTEVWNMSLITYLTAELSYDFSMINDLSSLADLDFSEEEMAQLTAYIEGEQTEEGLIFSDQEDFKTQLSETLNDFEVAEEIEFEETAYVDMEDYNETTTMEDTAFALTQLSEAAESTLREQLKEVKYSPYQIQELVHGHTNKPIRY